MPINGQTEITSQAMRTLQKLPASGDEREALRVNGQFWTPNWLAKAMAGWVIQHQPSVLFDPAVGPGTFFAAARELGFKGELHGYELNPETFTEGWKLGLEPKDFQHVQIADFIGSAALKKFPAIVSNPPYIRHHRLTENRKLELKELAQSHLGFSLDGRIGLHIFSCFGAWPSFSRPAGSPFSCRLTFVKGFHRPHFGIEFANNTDWRRS